MGIVKVASATTVGLLNQLSKRQRELAFAYKGAVNSWDEDVPGVKG